MKEKMNLADALERDESNSENQGGPTKEAESSNKRISGDLDASLNGSISSSAGFKGAVDPKRKSADSKPYNIPEDQEIQEHEEE